MSNTGQIIKSRSTERFTTIPNEIAQSTQLTFEEKGLLIFLLSLPSDWVLYKTQLHEKTGEQKGTIDRVWKNLSEKGYIVSVKVLNNGKFAGWNHVVYDVPINPEKEISRDQEIPMSGFTEVGETMPIQILNTNTNTKSLQKHNKDIYIELLNFLNQTLKKNYRTITGAVESKINARLKEGFTVEDIKKAILNASKDDYHAGTGFKYITLEFITRADKLDKFLQVNNPEKPKQTMNSMSNFDVRKARG